MVGVRIGEGKSNIFEIYIYYFINGCYLEDVFWRRIVVFGYVLYSEIERDSIC